MRRGDVCMSRKSGYVRYTDAELRAMEKRGESKTDWKAAARKPLPSGRDPDDAMEEIESAATEPPKRLSDKTDP